MLSVEDMQTMMVEELTGKPPTLRTPEADEFRKSFRRDMESAAKAGIMLTIPNEWPQASPAQQSRVDQAANRFH